MTMKLRSLLALAPLTLATSAGAISSYQQEVPNGATFRCQTCHVRSGGGEGWNDFGQAILVAGGANPAANPNDQNQGFGGSPSDYWLDICNDDADGDGATNGDELGDLDCDAVEDEGVVPSNPGDATSVPEDPGEPGGGGGGDDLGGGGCASTGGSAAVMGLGLLALLRRRR
jgi:uncharacterized protein (TIGR03382 family)